METIKSFTDIKQSAQLALLLPAASADMRWYYKYNEGDKPQLDICNGSRYYIPCWSLAALFNYLREIDFFPEIDADEVAVIMSINYYNKEEGSLLAPVHNIKIKAESFIGACYEMILKLHEEKIL